MFRLAEHAGKIPHRPRFPSIEVRNTRTGFFEDTEFAAVLQKLRPELRPVAEFALLTGWRRGEVLGLGWRQVDFTAGTVRLEPGSTKNDEARTFPFAALPELAELLQRQRDYTTTIEREAGQIIPWVFHRAGRPIKSFHEAWANACRRAGVVRLFHDLRRTAVRNLERAGVSRSWAMKLTGHKTESVYRRYAIVSEADLAAGVAKLATLRAGARPFGSGPGAARTSTLLTRFPNSSAEATGTEGAQVVEAIGAGGGGRTHTRGEPNGILSPARLPVSPLRHLM